MTGIKAIAVMMGFVMFTFRKSGRKFLRLRRYHWRLFR
jgi:hypothetical protein